MYLDCPWSHLQSKFVYNSKRSARPKTGRPRLTGPFARLMAQATDLGHEVNGCQTSVDLHLSRVHRRPTSCSAELHGDAISILSRQLHIDRRFRRPSQETSWDQSTSSRIHGQRTVSHVPAVYSLILPSATALHDKNPGHIGLSIHCSLVCTPVQCWKSFPSLC